MNELFESWYLLLGYFEGFSEDMFDFNLYVPIGFCMVLIPVVMLAVYYYVINSRRFNRWWHWLLLVLLISVINFFIAHFVSLNGILDAYEGSYDTGYPLISNCMGFSFINALWSFVVSFVWSMIIKWGSSQCRRTPF